MAFEAATIKPTTETGLGNLRRLPGGRLVATRVPLRGLIRQAFAGPGIFRPEEQIVGGPGWLEDRFDIEAVAAAEFVPDEDGVVRQHLAMLRTLLEERFALRVHTEQREMPVYALQMSRSDGGLGPDLKTSTFDCRPEAPPRPDGLRCGLSGGGAQPGGLVFRGQSIGSLVGFLSISPAVGRIVRDETGLTGRFDYVLKFIPPFVMGGGANPDVDRGPTIFTALREQLGLKLEPKRGPVEIVVIDHIERLRVP